MTGGDVLRLYAASVKRTGERLRKRFRGLFLSFFEEKKADSAKISTNSAEISTISENVAQQKCCKMCYNVSSCNGERQLSKPQKEKNKALYETD